MYISKKLGQNITDMLIEADITEDTKRDILIYCFEYIFDQIILISTFLLLGLVLGQFKVGLLFLTVFYLLRSFGGGIHATTERLCIISSTIIYLVVLWIAPFSTLVYPPVWLLSFLIAMFIIIFLAPVESPNKPLSTTQRIQMRQKCIICCAVIFLCFVFFYVQDLRLYYGTIAICAILVSVSMLLGKLTYSNISHGHASHS